MQDSLEKHFEQFEGRFDSHLEVYRENGKEMAKLGENVHNLKESIDSLKKSNEKSFDTLSSVDKDFDKRMRFVENKTWWIIGIGVATATIFVWIGSGWFDDIQENITNSAKTAIIEQLSGMEFEGTLID